MAQELGALIRSGIRTGRLPPFSKGHQLFGVSGGGERCSYCGDAITRAEVQYEVDFGHNEVPLKMHLRCYQMWYGETKAVKPKEQH